MNEPQTPRRETANRLRIAIGAFKRRVQDTHVDGDLSGPQLTALSRLDHLGPTTTTALARREQMTPQAMGATLASLERLGLIARSAHSTDARQSLLSLTPEGLTAVREGRSAVTDKVTAALESSFDDAEVEILAAAAPLIERLAQLL